MATSKTLTPTNVTIQIPDMTDAPDQSVNSNCIDKLGDAVNTLNSKLTWENVTPTLDSSKIATGSVACVKRDGMAYVFLNNVTFKASGSNQLAVITGLPQALIQCGGVFNGIDAANTAQISAAGDSWWMGTGSTSLNVHLGSTFAKGHWANVMYPCA